MRGKAIGLGIVLVAAHYLAIVTACSTFSDEPVPSDDAAADGSNGDVNAAGDAAETGTGDAADGGSTWVPCQMRAPSPFFCADFDEISHAIYQSGGKSLPPLATAGAAITFGAPAVSAPSALSIASIGGTYVLKAQGSSNVKVLQAAFDVQFEALASDPVYTIATIGVRNPAFDHCYGYLVLDQMKVRVETHCSIMPVDGGFQSNYRERDVTPGLPVPNEWIHVELKMDLQAMPQTVTIRIGNAPPVIHELDVMAPFPDVSAGGTPYFDIGIQDNGGTVETAAFDNIVVD